MLEPDSLDRPRANAPPRFAFSELNEVDPERSEWLEIVRLRRLPVLAYGARLYGTIDQVPGVFYVATLFFHVYWLPLLPRTTWLKVLDTRGHAGVCSTPIQLSLCSIAFTWLRMVLGLTMAVGLAAGLGGVLESMLTPRAILPTIILLGAVLPVWLGMRVLRGLENASPDRAEELALLAGFPPHVVQDLANTAVDNDTDAQLAPCPNCGRMLAKRSRICPRCEWRRG